MAKYERRVSGDFNQFLNHLERSVMHGSASASFEGGSDFAVGDVACAVRVYERYSVMGSNRVSLNLTLVGQGTNLFLSAITAGGSQAMLFKLNTLGEEAFLDTLIEAVERWAQGG